jgi:hypothetical protein
MNIFIGIIILIVVFIVLSIRQKKWEDKKWEEQKKKEFADKCEKELKDLVEGDAEARATTETNADNLHSLGCTYDINKEYKKAAAFFAKAAMQEHMDAQFYLGSLFSEGQGVIQDFEKSRYWYNKAAMQGHSTAQYNLGVLYYNGEGGSRNVSMAKYYFEKSAKQGNTAAKQMLGSL